MRYDQYYLVHRLIEHLSGEEGEEEGGNFPHIGQIRFSNGSDKKKACNTAFKLMFFKDNFIIPFKLVSFYILHF